jgi:predicted negative regulator of RcsB-dependent stress response
MPSTATSANPPAVEATAVWQRHRREIIAGIVLLLVVALAWAGCLIYAQNRASRAADALAHARTVSDYQKVISEYRGTGSAATAYLLLADQQREQGKFAEANATLQKFITEYPKHELIGTARMAMAANLQSMGKPDEALSTYQRLVAAEPHAFTAPLALMAQVPLLKAKGANDEARRVCEQVKSDYPDSFAVGEATRQLRLLEPPKPVATPAPAPAASAAPVAPRNPTAPPQPKPNA